MARAKSRKSSRPKKDKARPSSPGRNPFSFLALPAVRRLILIVVLVALAYYFSYKYQAGVIAWGNNVLALFGLGLAIMGVALGLLIWVIWRGNFSRVLHRWNWILGGISLALALWGTLSFFVTTRGILYRATLGGSFGQSLIGTADITGVLRVTGFVLLGVVLLMPHKVWHALSMVGMFFRRPFKGTRKPLARGSQQPRPEASPQYEVSSFSPAPAISSKRAFDAGVAGGGASLGVTSRVENLLAKRGPIVTPGGWQLPPIDILDRVAEVEMSKDDIAKRAQMIEDALSSYGVEARVVQTNSGPTVTQFGVEPGWDRKYREVKERAKDGSVQMHQEEVSRTRIRVDRITSLANDLALALASPSIRIEAPVPGKPVVGIEVPNTIFGSVGLRSVIESTAFQKIKARSKLTIALGKGAGGEAVAADLARMPHLLIAGATGSGKTVCLDSIICSLLLYNSPDEVQFIMVDPKRVELVIFDSIPHLVAPVVVDTGKAIKALRWLTQEMDNRYHQMARAGVRNIESYNKNCAPAENMPYLVLIIDELADLMITAFDEVEHTLCRLAQLARATGIHIVVATQRPSVDVVTGLIKANFPTRMSFAVTSQVDSRTILDMVGAEKLLGRGDMLYMPTEESKPKRLQGTFVSDADIDKLVYFWGSQKRQEMRTVNFDDVTELVSPGQKVTPSPDSLLEEARRLASEHEHISASFLQRRLRIGYPRAARLMETLAEEGLTGTAPPHEGR
ncbi:MAG: DNA translocase FtsK [Dehalococcoidia bacterium]|nr:DNA translocase FtsK [Dehalococcoidia bacterium]